MENNSDKSTEEDTKICTKCKNKLKHILFDGNRNVCKPCRNQQIRIRRVQNKNKTKILLINKECIRCNVIQTIKEYTKLADSQDGYSQYCKSCVRKSRKKKSNTETITITNTISNINDKDKNNTIIEKICFKCEKNLPIKNFKENKKIKDGYVNICNDCWPKKQWNKEKQKASEKKYVENNKEKIKLKWKNDGKKINKRIRNALNKRIKQSLFSGKNNKTFTYVGCDISFLQKWFEFCFEENMSWDNYGEWHIDHIKPCCAYDMNKEEDIKECFNWKNIRPCWAKENLEKNGKVDNDLIELYKNKVNIFQNALLNTEKKQYGID
jgi:hypothetical protein